MIARRALLAFACVAISCGGAAGIPPAPSATARPSVSAPATVPASPAAAVSPKGWIVVRAPLGGSRVTSPLTISGEATAFEATLQWRIVDGGGRVFAEGIATASAGAPTTGTFSATATFAAPSADTSGAVEVYTRSPKDGQIDDIVRVPVVVAR